MVGQPRCLELRTGFHLPPGTAGLALQWPQISLCTQKAVLQGPQVSNTCQTTSGWIDLVYCLWYCFVHMPRLITRYVDVFSKIGKFGQICQ